MVSLILASMVYTSCGGGVAQTHSTTTAPTTPPTTRATYDIETLGPVAIIAASYYPVGDLARVSRFRSGVGHAYTDEFEDCRSMKHYFVARTGVDSATLALRAPVTGVVVAIVPEQLSNSGVQIHLRPDEAPAFLVILFHVMTEATVGDRVTAGDVIGHHAGDITYSDIAVFVDTPAGRRAVSAFVVMTDDVFAEFIGIGAVNRAQFTVSREERDTAPLQCDAAGNFTNTSTISDWVNLGMTG